MPEPVTQGQFFEAMRSLDARLDLHHRSQREHIDQRVGELEKIFRLHEKDDREIADRVLTVETERKIEKADASRHGAIAGSIAAGLVLAAVESIKRAFVK